MNEREIEFRGKRKDNGEWVYGHYHTNEKRDMHFILIPYICSFHPNKPEIGCVGYEIIPETVGQYTGFKNNGVKVFEGDIQRRLNPMKSKEEYAKNPYSYYTVKWKRYGFDMATLDNTEVIGNIHENPRRPAGVSAAEEETAV